MIVGDESRFSIKYEIDRPIGDWTFGRFSFLVSGEIVGNYDAGCTFRMVIRAMERLTKRQGNHTENTLLDARVNAIEAFHTIDDALYVDRGQSDAEVADARQRFAKLDVSDIALDVFDG